MYQKKNRKNKSAMKRAREKNVLRKYLTISKKYCGKALTYIDHAEVRSVLFSFQHLCSFPFIHRLSVILTHSHHSLFWLQLLGHLFFIITSDTCQSIEINTAVFLGFETCVRVDFVSTWLELL